MENLNYNNIVKNKEKLFMTIKELLVILKRFPKTAEVKLNGNTNIKVAATCDSDNNWAINLTEKIIDENEKSFQETQKSFDKMEVLNYNNIVDKEHK